MDAIFWIQSNDSVYFNPATNILTDIYGSLNIIGVVNAQIPNIKSIDKQDLKAQHYDIIIVTGKNASLMPILQEAAALEIDADKLVLDRTICMPGFSMKRYKRLRNSSLSILSQNCWSGFIYNKFGLQFLTPTINMFTTDKGFLDFLKDPMQNVNQKLKLQKMEFNPDLNINYPVFKIGKTEWFMNHYNDVKIARNKWYERRQRINWFNLLAVMYTEDEKILSEFDKLPYAKKVCFVPFETDLESGYYLNPAKYNNAPLWRLVNGTAMGDVLEYDTWDLLIYGKKTLIKIK